MMSKQIIGQLEANAMLKLAQDKIAALKQENADLRIELVRRGEHYDLLMRQYERCLDLLGKFTGAGAA